MKLPPRFIASAGGLADATAHLAQAAPAARDLLEPGIHIDISAKKQ